MKHAPNKVMLLVGVVVLGVLLVWAGSYVYLRMNSPGKFRGEVMLNYRAFPGGLTFRKLHRPLIWIDEHLTGEKMKTYVVQLESGLWAETGEDQDGNINRLNH